MSNTLTRWNPWGELEEFQNRILNAFNPRSAGRGQGNGNGSPSLPEWMPLVDITEDDQEYVITAELPEVKKEDVKVTVENGVLTITGERSFAQEEKNKRYHRIERAYGGFARSFTMPSDGDAAKVNAEFKEGVLKVHMGKSEAARPKQIEVKVS